MWNDVIAARIWNYLTGRIGNPFGVAGLMGKVSTRRIIYG